LPRSQEARAKAEAALTELVERLGTASERLVLIGGLVPQLLAASVDDAQTHIGTVDIDFGVFEGIDTYAEIESALVDLGWAPESPGWRWRRGEASARLTVEFLCDRDDVANESAVQLPGCKRLFALNLRGAGFAAVSWADTLIGEGGKRPPSMPAASLEAYLLMKAYTITTRGRDKDHYDFVYALLFNDAGGPDGAAERVLRNKLLPSPSKMGHIWREVGRRFERPDQFGPTEYAKQAGQANVELDEVALRRDARAAVATFLEALHIL
jgi:hypothetical protein